MTADAEGGGELPLLDGVRVLDWAEGVAGPYACLLLADLGADVVKVERPTGDWARTSGPGHEGGGHHYRAFNRNKRNLCLDLGTSGSTDVARRLIESADVMVTAYRPGVTERLGIGYEQAAGWNPAVVYVRISGYGYRGPLSQRPASDTILQAVSGLMSQIGDPAGDPQRVGVPVIDYLAARDAVIGAMAGLLGRTTGKPPVGPIDVSLFASAASYQAHLWQTYLDTGVVQQRSGHRNPSLAPAGLYTTADGRHIAIAVLRDEHFAKLCAAIDRDDIASDPRFSSNAARLEHRDALEAVVGTAFASRPFAEWVPRLVEYDVLAAPLLTIPDIEADPELWSILPRVDVVGGGGAGTAVGSPVAFGAGRASTPAASRGADTRDLLRELGYTDGEIDGLVASGVTPDEDDM
jgi:crotonobetainyl-CoA:carnitine CoA-transferase CaiB-like acyl-CoA transferase